MTYLKYLGYQADTAGGGEEALAFLTEEKYDLVLMDCRMPGMDDYITKPFREEDLEEVIERLLSADS